MPKFQSHDGTPISVQFSDDAELDIKTRGGQVYRNVCQPWSLAGWEHADVACDIMEFRVVRGSITKPKDSNANG